MIKLIQNLLIAAFMLLCVNLYGQDAISKILNVPYLTQPNGETCQSTCLRMMAMYYHNQMDSVPFEFRSIPQIWQEINTGDKRPNPGRNSWGNFVWWLNNNIIDRKFKSKETNDEIEAILYIIDAIDNGAPILLSVNHERSEGHIILVIGYENYVPNQSTADFRLICHDPNGKFDPELHSKLYGKEKYTGGMSLLGSGDYGPGYAVLLSPESIKRNRNEFHNAGKFIMMTEE